MVSTITFTTDFGLSDGYVSAMKGAILTINPEATLVDITHQIAPQNIREAAFIISTTYPYFPPRTIHLIVVDPGVGTSRRAIILRTPVADFVAPDNGVLSYVIHQYSDTPAFAITNSRYWRSSLSRTFHGRDIMAPVAAHLSLGVPPEEFGEPIDSPHTFPLPQPERTADGSLAGEVIHTDSFGNLITNIRETDLPVGTLKIEIGGRTITGLSETYAAGDGLLALIGSHGYLEISVRNDNAADYLKVKTGTGIRVSI